MSRPEQDPVDVTAAVLREWRLPDPGPDKESRGRTLIIGGSAQTPGAVLLAAEAALRSGAGKLQVATVQSVAARACRRVARGARAAVLPRPTAARSIHRRQTRSPNWRSTASAVLIGAGMIGEDATTSFMTRLVPKLRGPLVIDALGLAYLTEDLSRVAHLGGRVVLTPNRRELAIMLASRAGRHRGGPAQRGARGSHQDRRDGCGRRRGVMDGGSGRPVRGGTRRAGSVSACPDPATCFAGIVTGLSARGADPAQAAVWGSFLHGRAGDRLASTVGRVGFLAREVPACIPLVLSEIEV